MKLKNQIESDSRTHKWDNLKFAMILFVVIGHTIYYFYGSSEGSLDEYTDYLSLSEKESVATVQDIAEELGV